jgi:hypothetical protein
MGENAPFSPNMPLPNAPTRRPNNPETRLADQKTSTMLLILGLVFAFIGLGALLLPMLIEIPEMEGVLAVTTVVGKVALGLGGVLIAVSVWRRVTAQVKQ